MNWRELKDFCNSLNEEQLEKQVIIWREDEAIANISPMVLEEDYYMDPEEDEGCYPESEASSPIESLKKVYEKGDPILTEEF